MLSYVESGARVIALVCVLSATAFGCSSGSDAAKSDNGGSGGTLGSTGGASGAGGAARPTCDDNTECGPEKYCYFEDGKCGAAEPGWCRFRDSTCPDQGKACGCDGIIYEGCGLGQAGVSLRAEWNCEIPPNRTPCGSYYCDRDTELCGDVQHYPCTGGRDFTEHFCAPRPASCSSGATGDRCPSCDLCYYSGCEDGPASIELSCLSGCFG